MHYIDALNLIPSHSQGVLRMGDNPFCKCGALSDVNVVGDVQNFKVIDKVMFNNDITRLIWYSLLKWGYEVPCLVSSIDLCAFT